MGVPTGSEFESAMTALTTLLAIVFFLFLCVFSVILIGAWEIITLYLS